MKGLAIAMLAAIAMVAVLPLASSYTVISYACGTQVVSSARYCSGGWWGLSRRHCGYTYRSVTKLCYKYKPVDGSWTEWGEWQDRDECSVLCGGGSKDQERSRTCTNPAPAYGGADCDGESYQNRTITCGSEDCGDRCPDGEITYLAHATNDKRFYQCGNGVAYRHDCAPGSVYDPDLPGCTRDTSLPGTTCPATGVVVLADATDCTKYVTCVNGYSYVTTCPAGTKYDAASGVCVHKTGDC